MMGKKVNLLSISDSLPQRLDLTLQTGKGSGCRNFDTVLYPGKIMTNLSFPHAQLKMFLEYYDFISAIQNGRRNYLTKILENSNLQVSDFFYISRIKIALMLQARVTIIKRELLLQLCTISFTTSHTFHMKCDETKGILRGDTHE